MPAGHGPYHLVLEFERLVKAATGVRPKLMECPAQKKRELGAAKDIINKAEGDYILACRCLALWVGQDEWPRENPTLLPFRSQIFKYLYKIELADQRAKRGKFQTRKHPRWARL